MDTKIAKRVADKFAAQLPVDVNLQRVERVVDDISRQAKDMSLALDKYKKDPQKMKPQLENVIHTAYVISSDVRILLRTLGERGPSAGGE